MRPALRHALSLSVALIAIGPAPTSAEPRQTEIAGWIVSVDKDPFGDGDKVIVGKLRAGTMIAFRCFEREPQLAVAEVNPFRAGGLTVGTLYTAKLRIDERPIVTARAVAVSGELVQIDSVDTSIFRAAPLGRELAIRLEREGRYVDYRLALAGAGKAMPEFYRACGLSPDQK